MTKKLLLVLTLLFTATTATAQQVTASRDVGTLQQQGQINTLKNMIEALIGQNTAAAASITLLTNELSNVKTDVTNVQSSVTNVESNITNIENTIITAGDTGPPQNCTGLSHGQIKNMTSHNGRDTCRWTVMCLDGELIPSAKTCGR